MMDLQTALAEREASAEGFHALWAAFRDSDTDVLTLCEALETLGGWLRRGTWAAQKLLAEERQHALVVVALHHHGIHAEFARLACSLVALASFRCVENAGPFCRTGVVPEILAAMERHGGDSVVMDLGCEALWRLGERGGAPAIQAAGGTERLCEAMRVHRENPFLQSNACSALYPLIEPESPWLARMCNEAQAAMAAHIGHKPIARQAERLIKACEDAAAKGSGSAHQIGNASTEGGFPRYGAGTVFSEPPGTTGPTAATSAAQVTGTARSLGGSLEDWLGAVDDEGFLLPYLGGLHDRFASPAEVVHAYGKGDGGVDPRLFQDLGVHRLGHRRLFEVWFRDNAPRAGA